MGRAECRQCSGDVVEVCPECEKSELASLRAKLAEAEKMVEKLKQGLARQNNEVCQILGKALGYPWYKDDQKNFPGTTEADGVCEGEHVAETIASEAAAKLAEWEAAGRVLADSVWRFCGNAECYRHCDAVQTGGGCTCGEEKILDEIMAPVESNPLASRLVAEAGGTNG